LEDAIDDNELFPSNGGSSTSRILYQPHIPRPLLFDKKKCHLKTYQFLSCNTEGQWDLLMYETAFLSIASRPWSPDDGSDAAQITTLRDRRISLSHSNEGEGEDDKLAAWKSVLLECR